MQWKNASFKYESQTDRLILKVLTTNYANAVLNFQNRNRESFEAYEPTRSLRVDIIEEIQKATH